MHTELGVQGAFLAHAVFLNCVWSHHKHTQVLVNVNIIKHRILAIAKISKYAAHNFEENL